MQMKLSKTFFNLLSRYQIGLELSMRGSGFDGVKLLSYKCHKINFKCGGSYIDSPDWIKKATINSKKKCFQYAAMVALNYGEIKWNPERFQILNLL